MTPTAYITYAQLAEDCRTLANRLRGQIVGVVGIPRSGMLAAEMVALHLNLPCCTLEEFTTCGGFPRAGSGGQRLGQVPPRLGRVLVLDDSIWLGNSLNFARLALSRCAAMKDFRVLFGAIYAAPTSPASLVDHVVRVVPKPRYFEWNLFHHPDLRHALFDFDGILCDDPDPCEWEGEECATSPYAKFIAQAMPLHLPSVFIRGIVTGRLERWREASEHWLKQHGLDYGSMRMHPGATAAERRLSRTGIADFKASIYAADGDARLFIESNPGQAAWIAQHAKKSVICPAAGRVFQ